jgi:RNA polymerase sigma factor (sigma-70 family)
MAALPLNLAVMDREEKREVNSMASTGVNAVLRYLRRVAAPPPSEEAGDVQLLRRFLAEGDEAAFAILVQRHGPMVFGVCRRLLQDENDAEDAFQATFLVLVRKAASLGRPGSLGPWLYGVASRTARKARTEAAMRRARERQLEDLPAPEASGDVVWRDLRPLLDEEVGRLPHKYQAPFVLCYLEGKTNEEAAALLGCPKGTVISRLARARQRLRGRLERRGVTLSAGALMASLADRSAAAVPGALATATVQAARTIQFGNAAGASLVSARVSALTEGVVQTMFLTKMKMAAALVLMVGVLGSGVGLLGYAAQPGEGKDKPSPSQQAKPADKPKGGAPDLGPNAKPPAKEADEAVAVAIPEITDLLTRQLDFQGMDDPKTTLQEALDILAKRYGFTYVIDEAAFLNVDGVADVPATEIATKPLRPLKNVSLATVLRTILSRVPSPSGATFVVGRDNVLEITNNAAVADALGGQKAPPLVQALFTKRPLEEALRDLARDSGINVVLDVRQAEKAKTPVSATLRNVPVETAVRVLADMAELKPVRMDNLLYVTSRDNAKRLEEEEAKRREPQ